MARSFYARTGTIILTVSTLAAVRPHADRQQSRRVIQ